MDGIVAFIVPFVVVLALGVFAKNKFTVLHYALILTITIGLCFTVRGIMLGASMSATEYWGGYVEKITYYEPWDEMVTKTREVCVGHDEDGNPIYETETYQEREYHREEWSYVSSFSRFEMFINEKTYNKMKAKLNRAPVFRDMHRNYYRIDGDAYDIYWDRTVDHCFDLTSAKTYQNRIKASESHTIFRYSNITASEAKELGLKEYPEIEDFHSQNPIIGGKPSIYDINEIRYINAVHGDRHQFRTYILIFDGNKSDVETAEMQKGYWQGGNKNEFIVCLGVIGDSVAWCSPFSWCDEPKLELLTRSYFIDHPKLDIKKYGQWLDYKIEGNWNRKEFADFKYIKIGLTETQGTWLFILSIIFSIGIALICYNVHEQNKFY